VKKINETETLLDVIVEGILKKKGHDILVMNLKRLDNAVAKYFVVCHAESGTQVHAIAESIEETVEGVLNERVWHREGTENSFWILLDYADIVVHVFMKEYREFYNLENLWADAEIRKIEEE